jgi:hypothetical protein
VSKQSALGLVEKTYSSNHAKKWLFPGKNIGEMEKVDMSFITNCF